MLEADTLVTRAAVPIADTSLADNTTAPVFELTDVTGTEVIYPLSFIKSEVLLGITVVFGNAPTSLAV